VGAYGEIPPDLPALWVTLGHRDRAESLARLVADYEKVQASAGLAGALGAAGELDRAERMVRSIRARHGQIREPFDKTWAWTDLAWLAAISGDRARAGGWLRSAYSEARSITNTYLRSQSLLTWARVCAAGGDEARAAEFTDRARSLAEGELNRPTWQRWVLEALPLIVTGTADLDRAEALVRTVPDPYHRDRAAAGLAAMAAARGEHDRSRTLLGTITDEYRHARVTDALAALRGAGPNPDLAPYRRARVLNNLAEMVAAGGDSHAWGATDWAEPLARYGDDHMVIFAALAAGVAGGDEARASALADRAEAIVVPIRHADHQPSSLVALAWMVADAGAPARAAELAEAAEVLVRYTGRRMPTWSIAELVASAPASRDGSRATEAPRLPELSGTPKQRNWARQLRAAFVARNWGTRLPAKAETHLTHLTDARWWIEHRENLDEKWAELAELSRISELPMMTGGPRECRRATDIRNKLVYKRWGNEIPPGVREALDRLTDARWWIENEVGDGYPQAIDRALGGEVPEHDRRRMALPSYGPPEPPPHEGPCTEQPEYAPARKAAFAQVLRWPDLRAAKPGSLDGHHETCCGREGMRDGEKEGKQAWVEKKAVEIRKKSRRLTLDQARAEARGNLARIERNLDGWG
jgi:hypothetical protein